MCALKFPAVVASTIDVLVTDAKMLNDSQHEQPGFFVL